MLVNGTQADHISIRDRGLLYGDGVFETIMCQRGEPILFNEHMQRLSLGCQRLNLITQNFDEIANEIQLVADGEDCIIKLILTRGVRERGYAYNACDLTYSRILDKSPIPKNDPSYYTIGVNLTSCRHRLSANKKLAGIKHLNRLDQVIARSECPAGYQEGLMFDHDDNLIEGTMTNVFVLSEGVWCTPDLEYCGVKGVLREHLLNHAKELALDCEVKAISHSELEATEAMFICNSVIGIWPVTKFDHYSYSVHADVKHFQNYLHNNISVLYPA